jgi:hypothetical protein
MNYFKDMASQNLRAKALIWCVLCNPGINAGVKDKALLQVSITNPGIYAGVNGITTLPGL